MTNGIEILLSVSLSGGVLALVLLALHPLLKDITSKKWQYYIWIIVALRLLLPFSPDVSVAGALFSALPAQTEQYSSAAIEAPSTPIAANHDAAQKASSFQSGLGGGDVENIPNASTADEGAGTMPKINFDPAWILGTLFIGTAAMAVWRVAGYLLLMRKLKKSAIRPDKNTAALYRLLCESMDINRPPTLIFAAVHAPLLAGLFRPVIALPMNLSQDHSLILLHELIHHKRKDTLFKLFFAAALCLHWFNPAVWLAARRMGRDCELACDEAVMEITGARGYGEALLRFAESRAPKNALCLSEGGKIMKERITAVKKFSKGKKGHLFVIALLTAAFIACAVFMGAAKPAGEEEVRFSYTTQDENGTVKTETMDGVSMYKEGSLHISSGERVTYTESVNSKDATDNDKVIIASTTDPNGGDEIQFISSNTPKEYNATTSDNDYSNSNASYYDAENVLPR